MRDHYYIRRFAFTLAEVLITLGIIGVVAAMTLPSLISKYKEQVIVNQLTATYSLVSQALERMIQAEGTVDNWGNNTDEQTAKFDELFPKYIQVVKKCPPTTNGAGCTARSYSNRFNSDNVPSASWVSSANSYLLKNGAALQVRFAGTCQQDKTLTKKGCDEGDSGCSKGSIRNYGTYSHRCATIRVDINGPAKPNEFDKDMFGFALVQDGLVPTGSSKENIWTELFENQCLGKSVYNDGGGHCAAWVIYNKNMDYLHCDDLSWSGKSKCK